MCGGGIKSVVIKKLVHIRELADALGKHALKERWTYRPKIFGYQNLDRLACSVQVLNAKVLSRL